MASDKQTIIAEIKSYMARNGGSYSQWYAGIATDPKQRLFNDHAVNDKSDVWIYHQCASSEVARAIETYFHAQGMKGGTGGGDDNTDYIYAYMITRYTVE
jgi:hypothetical protein